MFRYYCIFRGAGMSKLLDDNPTMSDFRGNSKELARQLILFLQSLAQVRNSILSLTKYQILFFFKYLTYFVNCGHFHLFRTGNNYLKSPCGYKKYRSKLWKLFPSFSNSPAKCCMYARKLAIFLKSVSLDVRRHHYAS